MQKNKENLILWNSVETTNPKFTKDVNIGARKFTAIDPYYQLKTASEVFGTFGDGFGLEEIEHKLTKLEGTQMTLLITKGVFYYVTKKQKNKIPLTTSTPLVYISSKGKTMTDEDAFKKNETDLITKALSRLGFNTDVFLGKYDDSRYVNTLKGQFEKQEELEKAEKIRQQKEDSEKKKEELKNKKLNKEDVPQVVSHIIAKKTTLESVCKVRTVPDEIKNLIEAELLKANKQTK